MNNKNASIRLVAALSVGLLSGCAGPLDPSPIFSPGPGAVEVLLVLVLLLLGYLVVRPFLFRKSAAPETHTSAEDTVRKRYAGGHISAEQFHEMLDALRRDTPPH